MRPIRLSSRPSAVVALIAANSAFAGAGSAQSIRTFEVSRAEATSTDRFGKVLGVRELGDGTLLINDSGRRQLIKVDRSFGNAMQVLTPDTASLGYGRFEGALVPHLGDSLLFIARGAMAMIDGRNGRVLRWAPGRAQPLLSTINGLYLGVDPEGNYIYKANVSTRPPAAANQPGAAPAGPPPEPSRASRDTGVIVRGNFQTRAVRPIARVFQQPTGIFSTERTPDGRMVARTVMNVLPIYDEFVVLSDGVLAVLRASDYHFDFVHPDGQTESAPKIPFTFTNLSIADRESLIDSARAALAKAEASGASTIEREGAAVATGVAMARATGLNNSSGGFNVNVQSTGDVAAGVVTANTPQGARGAVPFALPTTGIEYVPAAELPSVRPAFAGRALTVDRSDNIWVRTSARDASMQGAITYDVVNRYGTLVQRVKIPAGRTLVGFGRENELFLTFEDGKMFGLERVKVKK
jgi:hypothetical protein